MHTMASSVHSNMASYFWQRILTCIRGCRRHSHHCPSQDIIFFPCIFLTVSFRDCKTFFILSICIFHNFPASPHNAPANCCCCVACVLLVGSPCSFGQFIMADLDASNPPAFSFRPNQFFLLYTSFFLKFSLMQFVSLAPMSMYYCRRGSKGPLEFSSSQSCALHWGICREPQNQGFPPLPASILFLCRFCIFKSVSIHETIFCQIQYGNFYNPFFASRDMPETCICEICITMAILVVYTWLFQP